MQLWQDVRRRAEHVVRDVRSDRPFTRRRDFVLLAVLLAPSVSAAGGPVAAPAVWPLVVLLITAAVAVRRSAPLLSLVLAALPVLLYPVLGSSLWTATATAVLSFLAGRRVRRVWHAHAVFVTVALAGLLMVDTFAEPKDWVSLLLTELGACLLPWWAGNWWKQRSDLARAGWKHAEQLEWRQRFVAEQARLKERARIAQDIHDSLGHELSVMALLAGGLELAPGLATEQRAVVQQLRERCTMATERLHDVIGLLREDSAPPLRPPHQSVAELVRRFELSGTPVRFHEEGADSPGTPLLTALATYRVVQESLTNAAKHAPGAPVSVRLAHRPDGTQVSVFNELPRSGAAAATAAASGSGLGLIGLDERVRLAGGTLRAGPREGGFEVRAELPHMSPSAAAPESAASAGPWDEAPWPDDPDEVAAREGAGPDAPDAPPPAGARRSGSTAALLRARARVRRDVRRAALVPVLLGSALVLCLAGLYVYTSVTTSVAPDAYARMRLGQSRAELAGMLPERHISEPPPIVAEPEAPAGTDCEYFRAGDGVLQFDDTMYRLCFKDDVLVAKDTL